MIHRFVSRDLTPIDFDHNLIDLGMDVNFNAIGGKIAAVWFLSKEGICECQAYESWGIACRHQCAVTQILGQTKIIGGCLHPFYIVNGHTSAMHIRTSVCSAVPKRFNPAPTQKEKSQQLNKLFQTMLHCALQNTGRFESARNTLLEMCTEFGCDVPEDIDTLSVNPVRTDIKKNGAISNATKMPQRLMGATDSKPNKKRGRIDQSESSSRSKSSSSQVIELLEDGREKEQLN